ncbi:glycosyltransferase family 1 protein [Peribacillus simplex]|uniref:glycosyltransferase family 1 protein n=1 Tax=Peribacillus simplex TaxID=1478 RepID=UPI003D2E4749
MNKKPIKILHIVSVMNLAGIESFLMNIYREIDRSKIQFDFLVTREEVGFYDKEILSLGGNIHNIPHVKKIGLKNFKKNVDVFFQENNEYSIVHCHMNTWAGFFLPIAKKNKIPIRIAHSHIADFKINSNNIFQFLYKKYNSLFIKRNSTHFFACSEKAGDWLFGEKNREVQIINNSIDAIKFSYNQNIANKLRKEFGISKDTFVIGNIGRFNVQKNHIFLIDIFKEVFLKKPDSILCLIGEGELQDEIIAKVEKEGLSAHVKFLGVRSDINKLMMMFDTFLFPSLFEGFGIVALEAQAAGLKTIASDVLPIEVKITDYISFISLNQSSEFWASEVLKYSNGYNRRNTYNEILNAGFV